MALDEAGHLEDVLAARLALFPVSAQVNPTHSEQYSLTLAGHSLEALAQTYGTPLYLYDAATLQAALESYQQALQRHYPGSSSLTYAGKAFLCQAMAQWVGQHGLSLDCTGLGELAIAAAAGLPRSALLVHGVNKSPQDLQAAYAQAGTLVIDNLDELAHLPLDTVRSPQLGLRLKPGQAVATHAFTQTGQLDSKFGLTPPEFLQAAHFLLERRLPLTGLHFHLGSHFHDPAPLTEALQIAYALIHQLDQSHGWRPTWLSPGGGWGVAYQEADLPHPPIDRYVSWVAQAVQTECQRYGLPLPRLQLEPGRSLIAQAGVALYRVGAIKNTPARRWVLIDGGLADNPRPALYGARYSALPVTGAVCDPLVSTWVGGPYCESGDVLLQDLPLPPLQPGDLLAVPVSGAYQLSMASNYNGARRPAVVWLEPERVTLIQRRETVADLLQRDHPLCTD